MASIGKIARRSFLFGGIALAGGAAFGTWVLRRPAPNPLRAEDGAFNPFVVINETGITLIAPRAEMGQGTQTTWAALIAEELDVRLDQVRIEHGPPAQAYYNTALMAEGLPHKGYDASSFEHGLGKAMGAVSKVFSMQVTGGSTAMKDGYERMRAAGAGVRELLKAAAATRLGLAPEDLRSKDAQVIAPDGRALDYTELARSALAHEIGEITLRERSEWNVLGKTQMRFDIAGKSTGTARYGIDTRLPGMRYAAVRMAPTRTGVKRYDAFDAERMAGVDKVVEIPGGLAVIASNSWLAMQAVQAIEVEWQEASYPADTQAMIEAIEAAFDTSPDSKMRSDGEEITNAELSAEYRVPFLAHATMEPMNATVWLDGGKLRIWCGNQGPTFLQTACADAAGIDEEDVEVNVTMMGGGFGRRGEFDYAVSATHVAKSMPGVPVNVLWSREEDMRQDFYRPAAIARMRGALKDGLPTHFDAAVASPSISAQALKRWMGFAPMGPSKEIADGLYNQPYAIPNYHVRGHRADIAPPLGFWRSVGASYNGFFHECFLDEMAHAGGVDPLKMRLKLTRDEWRPAYLCLEALRDLSGWSGQTPEGVGRGLAMVYSFGTPVAVVIEVRADGPVIRLSGAWMVADPGVALDPGNIEAQLTGGLAYGLSAAIGEEISFADGAVFQENFPDYPALRMAQMPPTQVVILENQKQLGGIGEPGTPPAAPALANALFDLTGKRVRELPLGKVFDFVM